MTPKELQEKIDWIEKNHCASYWLKKAWAELKDRDIVDAIADVELLADICMAKYSQMKDQAGTTL